MKFVILALLALASGLNAAELNLKNLGFVLFGKHGDGDATTVAAGSCPLGTLPDTVFLHKTFKKGDHFFTWVRPVHAKVHKLVCGSLAVWEAAVGEVLVDLHFVGNKDSEKFLHLELFHPAVGSHHLFLKFAAGASPGVGVHLGMGAFVVGVHKLVAGLPELAGLPAHPFVHALAAHAAHLAHHDKHAALSAEAGLVVA
uniref:Signal peptide containing protein n=1 Tax=Theileria annulata TaxID=5874 RepID=A0A3B0MT32_THEAN